MQSHIRHHGRFYTAALLGLVVGLALSLKGSEIALVAAGDVFFAAYLASAAYVALRATPQGLRRYAAYDDEGIAVIFLLTGGAIAVSLTAILLLLRQEGPRDALPFAAAVASIPLGWFTLHALLAFRYAHLYYTCEVCPDGSECEARGLQFPATDEPDAWDFLYYAFVVGMTGQVSDVQVLTGRMRRLTLGHGIGSFFFNTVIVALTVSIVANKGV